jgi:hypothetical protein
VGSSRKVAVIAVHGVGVHPAGQTQNDMADLLLSLPAREYSAERDYGPFRSVSIQIPLSPLKACPFDPPSSPGAPKAAPPPPLRTRIADLYQEKSADFAFVTRTEANLQRKSIATGHDSVAATGEAGRRYTQMLLEDYQGGSEVAGNKYCTARLQGTRLADETQVHIYEVLWADLAKPSNGLLRFFLGLFQLLLHLASLSRIAVDTGAAEGTSLVWRVYRHCQRYAIRLLQIFAPLLQLLVLVACGSCLSTASSYTQDKPALPLAMGAVTGLFFGLIFIITVKNRVAIGPWLWSLLAIMPSLVGIAIPWGFMAVLHRYYHLSTDDGANVTAALAFWLLPGIGLFWWILSYYEDVRKGVRATGIVLFATAFVYFVIVLKLAPNYLANPTQGVPLSRTFVPLAAFWTAKVLLGYLRFCWFLIISLAFAALILGRIAWRSEQDTARRARARAAVRTSRFAFALPCISFSLITLAIWASLIHFSSGISSNPIFPDAVINAPFPHLAIFEGSHPHLSWIHKAWYFFSHGTYAQCDSLKVDDSKLRPSSAFISAALAWSVGYQLPVSLTLITIAGFLLTWWALPSALTERFPYRNDAKDKQHAGKAPRDTDNATSLHMGTWLSRGLDSTSVITFLLWCSIFLAPAAWILLLDLTMLHPAHLLWLSDGLSRLKDGLHTLQHWTIVIVYNEVLAAAVILAGLARSGSVVLGIVLDVDTYLRDTPREAPPRARIFERYMSTLRYIDAFEDSADGRGYDEIVIVAHSLGALISGDLLHFLHSRYSLEKKISTPIKLLTMGNPARQLLNRFFPYLYDWVKAQPDNGAHPLPAPQLTTPASIPDAQLPHPHELGLGRWVSAYRSGDYVGRSLWLDEWYLRTPNDADPRTTPPLLVESDDGTHAEMCIGAGAHTHYMDDTAPDIAWMLDQLISRLPVGH